MSHPALQQAPRHQLLALGLAALVTSAVLSGLVGLAADDHQALLAQQLQQRSQAMATNALRPAA